MSQKCDILVAEDDEGDVFFIERAFKEAELAKQVRIVRDGMYAIQFLDIPVDAAEDRLPALVILDLKMPRRNGFEVLRWMRSTPATSCIPVFIFSSSNRQEDIEQAYADGANAFIVKPSSTADRLEVARLIKNWLKANHPPLAFTEGAQAAARAFVVRKQLPP